MQLSNETESTSWSAAIDGANYLLRPFARAVSDLDVDFENARQPWLVTQILTNCVKLESSALSETDAWSWTLKKRLQALLQVAIVTRGNEMELQVVCLNRHCRERFELPLTLEMFQESPFEETLLIDIDDRSVELRLPNGCDQRHWLQHPQASAADIAKNLLLSINNETPQDDWQIPPEWIERFEQALEAQDRLMTLQFDTSCPVCETELGLMVDLEAQLLTCLRHEQQKLLFDIYQLALAYHWSEAEILQLSPQRRRFYLNQLNRQSGSGVALT
jgi:hypothetical protein